MQQKLKFAITVSIVVAVGSAAFAQYPENVVSPETSFEELDLNKDGKVSKDEIRRKFVSVVESIDLNGDEKLSVEELMRQHSERAKFRVARMIKRLDSDTDGSLSFAELKGSRRAENLNRLFNQIDMDNDGFVSKEEVQKARNAHQR